MSVFTSFPELVCVLVAGLLSLLACSWVLWGLQFLDRTSRRRLFPTQITHLAIADLLFATSLLGENSMNHLLFGTPPDATQWLCRVWIAGARFGRHTSVLCEVHIALCFAMVSLRWLQTLQIFKRLLLLAWVIGAGLCAVETNRYYAYYSDTYKCHTVAGDAFLLFPLTVSLVVCTCAYTATLAQALRSPSAVRRAVCRRAVGFLLSFLVSYTPRIVLSYFLPSLPSYSGYRVTANVCELLSGFLNMLVYTMQSRYAKRMQNSGVWDSSNASVDSHGRRPNYSVSFHTCFSSTGNVEEFEVPHDDIAEEPSTSNTPSLEDEREEAEVDKELAAARRLRKAARELRRADRNTQRLEEERQAVQILQQLGL